MSKFTLFLFLLISLHAKSQDCYDYWDKCHNDSINNYHDHYQLVVNENGQGVSKSAYISDVEVLETQFDIFSGRDYRMSICTTYDYKPILILYELGTSNVIYDNTKNDSCIIFEFEQRFNMMVKAVIRIPQSKKRNVSHLIVEKPKRYCIGFKLESMITRK
jgi:hypothetical protein